jgi:hypothetical protein
MPQHQGPLSRRLLLLVLLLVLVVAVAEFALAQPTTSEPDSTFERDREGQCAYCMAHMLYEVPPSPPHFSPEFKAGRASWASRG